MSHCVLNCRLFVCMCIIMLRWCDVIVLFTKPSLHIQASLSIFMCNREILKSRSWRPLAIVACGFRHLVAVFCLVGIFASSALRFDRMYFYNILIWPQNFSFCACYSHRVNFPTIPRLEITLYNLCILIRITKACVRLEQGRKARFLI